MTVVCAFCPHAVLSSCVHSTGHNDTHRLTIPLFSNMFITLPWISFQAEWWAGASCKQAHAQLLHMFSMQDSSTRRAQTNTSHRQGRKKKSVSPEQLTPWSTLDLCLSSKDRISVRLRSESKGKGSMGRGDEFYPSTTRSDQVQAGEIKKKWSEYVQSQETKGKKNLTVSGLIDQIWVAPWYSMESS